MKISQFNKPDIGQFSFASFAHSKNFSLLIPDTLALRVSSIDSTTPSQMLIQIPSRDDQVKSRSH